MNNPPRKRIVINLDDPSSSVRPGQIPQYYGAAKAPRRRRWPKVLAALFVIVVVVVMVAAAGGFFWWRHYQTTPAYTLALLVDAVQRNDMATFDRLVDSDKVVSNLASQVVEKTASPIGLIPGLTKSAAAAVPPSLMEPIKQGVRDRIKEEFKKLPGASEQKPFILIALTVPTLVKVTNEQNTGRVAATMLGQPFELTMEKTGETWRVVALKDDNLVSKIISEFGVDQTDTEKVKSVEPGSKNVRRRRR
jgi:hypothetical protein